MSQVAIVSYSSSPQTDRVVETVAVAAQAQRLWLDEEGQLDASGWALLGRAVLIAFASPTRMGGPAWQFKRFADDSETLRRERRWKDKLAAGITHAAWMDGDKQATLGYFVTLAMQHGMLWVGNDELPSDTSSARRDDANYIGGFAGLMTVAPSDVDADAMQPGDLITARLFGERLAAVAATRCS